MLRPTSHAAMLPGVILSSLLLIGCTPPGGNKPWPESPLYEPPTNDENWVPPASRAEAIEAMVGHYAHYDVVAYTGETPNGPLNTFIISYGFTDLYEEDGELIEFDRFCHAEHRANQNMKSIFRDEATQAIEPRVAIVDVFEEDGEWKIWRPATPTLIGIDGDPDQPLSMDPNDPNINDDDGDGNPGVTVSITLFNFLKGDLFIARREIFQNDLTLYSNGVLQGVVVDESEQLVIGATLDILNEPNNPPQYEDRGLSPMMLVPISEDLDSCEELMERRDEFFPEEPDF
jgi:hypothetical protein